MASDVERTGLLPKGLKTERVELTVGSSDDGTFLLPGKARESRGILGTKTSVASMRGPPVPAKPPAASLTASAASRVCR